MDKDESQNFGWDVAKAVGYDGAKIVDVFIAALHYSGVHGFADEVQESWNNEAEREEQMFRLSTGSLGVGF